MFRRCSSAILVCVWALHAYAAPSQTDLSKVRQDLAATKEQASALQSQLEDNQETLESLSSRAAELALRLHKTESRVTNEEDKADDIENERRTKQAEFDERRQEYAKTVSSLLAMHRIPPTAIFADPEALEPTLRAARVLEHTNGALAARAALLKEDIRALKALESRANNQQKLLAEEKTQLAEEQRSLREEIRQRQILQVKLSADHEKASARMQELSRKSTSLQDLLNRIAEEERKRSKAQPKTGDFANAKGIMRNPVAGNVLHRFGDKKNENETWRGMVLKARSNGTVVAPYEGEIAFTGPFRDYGRMVLIRHGNGYISLLAGLGDIDVALGQAVRRGEPIGTMPAARAPELYLELRDRSKPIDPADWFANVGRRLATN